MIEAQPSIRPRKSDAQNSFGFWDTNGSSNLSQTSRPSDSQQKKRTCWLFLSDWPQDKTERNRRERDKYLDLVGELKKPVKHETDGDANCKWRTRSSHQTISTGIRGLGNKKTSGDHPNYSIVKICQTTKSSPGDLRLAVTQTPMENHQLTLVWKTLKRVK